MNDCKTDFARQPPAIRDEKSLLTLGPDSELAKDAARYP
jgi:hypothetical protein